MLSAAPAATPKHFTDEELKEQYGIHLATRLPADGDGKEAKWADIDDDEDDWAPETIEWNDGTKIILPPTDTASVVAQEQSAALALKEKQDEEAKSKVSAPKPTTIVGPNATVLKVGAAAQPKAGGLVLKAPSDKPTLVAKPTAPAPVRSPWASLPPVDKVPPVPINPPSQQPTSRFEQNDRRGSETIAAPSPAVQIAADSFTRTRRDTPNGTPGQLYNSQSGQYEPVNAGRRGSIRKEQNFRPPALLQRPTNNDQHGPAEPSAAFQTHRNQQDGGMWNRRASSTFSGDSGPRDRRQSMSKGTDQPRIPNDILEQRRESETLHSPLTPGSVQTRNSPRDGSQPPVAPHARHVNDRSPASASPQLPKTSLAGQPAAPSLPDEIINQKQLMREKREAAIKRRREQEEREEAEKKERIRIKMESLGMSPLPEKQESKKEVEKETEKKVIEKKPTENRDAEGDGSQAKVPEAKEPEVKEIENKKETVPETAPVPIKSQGPTTSVSHSPPKPPIPDASGAPKQYGMMKVHGPPLTNGVPPSERSLTERTKFPGQQGSSPQQEFINKPANMTPPMVNGDRDVSKQHTDLVPKSPVARNQDLRGARQQPWKSVPNDAEKFPGWNGASMTTHSSHVGNLWGPPANQNALGNGTFDRSVQRPQSRQAPYQEHYMSSVPQPIGPPRHLQRPRESPESNRAPEMVPVPVVEDFQTVPSFPSSEAAPTLPRSRPDFADHTTSREQPLLPPHPSPMSQQKLQPIGEQFSRQPDQQRSTLAAWGNFQVTSARDDAEKRQQAAQAQAARLAEEARTGVRHEIQLPAMNETWRQIKVDDQANQRKVIGVAKELNVPGSMTTPYMNGDIRSMPYGGSSIITATNGAGRSSRFFPGAGQGIHAHNVRAVSYTMGFNRTPSPPPPEVATHPAYARDQDRPVVNLPFAKPKPKVRLPPSFVTPVQPPMAEVHVMPLRAVSQPLVNNPTWQDRFNGLLGVKKPSPERKFAHVAEFSSTKVPLEVPSVQVSAAVSLPRKDETSTVAEEHATSKDVEDEEALFENREFGDLPVIKLPTQAPETGWQPARPPRSRGHPNKPNRPVEALSKDPFEEKVDRVPNGILIFVYMPGTAPETRKPKTMHVGHGHRPNGHTQRTRHVSGTPKAGKPYKPRDSSATYNSPKPTPNGLPRNPMPNVPSPSPRIPYGKNMTWSARVAGMAQ